MMYIVIRHSDYLAHHGVKGMKWGVRRYQNYDGSLKEAGVKQQRYNRAVRKAKQQGKAKTENLDDYGVGLTNFTTKYGELFVSGLTNGHDFDWQENITKVSTNENINPIAVREDFHTGNAIDENGRISDGYMKHFNPDYGARGTTQNCAKCSAVGELALRGYTLRAGRQSFPSSADAMEFWFNGAKPVEYSSNDCERSLRSYGAGTSGTISIRHANANTGHAMHWTNDKNGNFWIEDLQNGRRFDSVDSMAREYNADMNAGYRTYRLDNCEPNWDNMASDGVCRVTDDQLNSNYDANVWNRIEKRRVDNW